jgi:hypothetical protein
VAIFEVLDFDRQNDYKYCMYFFNKYKLIKEVLQCDINQPFLKTKCKRKMSKVKL